MPRKTARKVEPPVAINADEVRLLTADEAAALLRVGRAKMAELIKAGLVKTVPIGPRSRRIRLSALQQYVDSL